jgi:hypothetical protein
MLLMLLQAARNIRLIWHNLNGIQGCPGVRISRRSWRRRNREPRRRDRKHQIIPR